jgi:uncharacterized membrane protein YcaP (DUF421 family)
MDWHELAMTAVRATVIYVFLLVVLRVLGKRTVGGSTTFDFMVALILGEVVDEPIYGDVPMVQALLAIAVIAGWHYANSWLGHRSVRLDHLTGGTPTVLVRDGQLDRDAMRREHVNEDELAALLRLQQVDDVRDVARATLETTGELSVIRTEEARALQKRDLDRARRTAA